MNRNPTLAIIAVAATLVGVRAHAGCADPRTAATDQPLISLPAPAHVGPASPLASRNIVGTWLVTYVTGGAPGGQAYIQWHGDGTEWENINFPIADGNICMGSWMPVDARHVSRNHYGWLYTNGILSGYFNETETTTVALNGTYTGVTDIRFYDVAGNLQLELPGTSSAVRISP